MGDICSLVLMQREFFPLPLSPWKPQLHCWLSPFPPHAFQINIGAWLPTGCPHQMGAALRARGKPGAWGVVTGRDGEGVQGSLASLLTHSPKLISLESLPSAPHSEPSVPSQGVPVSQALFKEKQDRSPVVTAPPSLGETQRGGGGGVLLSSLRAGQSFFLPQGEPRPASASRSRNRSLHASSLARSAAQLCAGSLLRDFSGLTCYYDPEPLLITGFLGDLSV